MRISEVILKVIIEVVNCPRTDQYFSPQGSKTKKKS